MLFDVVVDVFETYTAKVETYQDGTPLSGYENPNYVKTGTKAYIRALGGTLDFELKIGTTNIIFRANYSNYYAITMLQDSNRVR